MPTLASELRSQLETAIAGTKSDPSSGARAVAEAGARAALEALAVHEAKYYLHMSRQQQELRNHLRARARQLGDHQETSGRLSIDHLVSECAYEHWHRMLFSRFLAENALLIEPKESMAISLDEAEELAREDGLDLWAFASRCAEQMLPQIFRPDDPLLQVSFAFEHMLKLEKLLASLPQAVFTASDALGWVYQFWQSKKKNEINDSGCEIGADEIGAVTQLFTEPYMVSFLLQNTLGAWWAGKRLATKEVAKSSTEADLRERLSLPGVTWEFLRFVRVEGRKGGMWRPAAGTFSTWPRAAKEIRVFDPCCGSGHFLVAALQLLVPIRMAEEGLTAGQAVDAVLRDNLYGLEIDERCTQIAAFALALAAWTYPGTMGYRVLPEMHIACTGLAPNARKENWLAIVGKEKGSERLRAGMDALYELFLKAPEIGSLIDLQLVRADLLTAGFDDVEPLLESVLELESGESMAPEVVGAAKGMARAARILNSDYHLVATNVPFLGRGDQCTTMSSFIAEHYRSSKADLATAFVERAIAFACPSCTIAVVAPRAWLTYTANYQALRRKLLLHETWNALVTLGKRAFRAIGGEIVDVVLLILTRHQPDDAAFALFDATHQRTPDAKRAEILRCTPSLQSQSACLANPGHVPLAGKGQGAPASQGSRLADFAVVLEGLSRGDVSWFDRCFWELDRLDADRWRPLIVSSTEPRAYGGCSYVFLWEGGRGALAACPSARIQGQGAWGRPAVFVSRTHLNAYLTNGTAHAQSGVAIVPRRTSDLPALWCFCSSEDFRQSVLRLNQKLIKPTGVIDKVPFDVAKWRRVAAQKCPTGTPRPHSDDPTQWYFKGHPVDSQYPLQVAAIRLLGYRWPRQTGSSFPECPRLGTDGLEDHADDDGIVCIPSVRGEEPAAERLRDLLAEALGLRWSARKERELITTTGSAADDLDVWLRNDFFEQHCQVFHQRPFVWHVWDGRKRDGFHALINYHRLCGPSGRGRKLLESLTYSYIGEWIARQKDGVQRGEGGAEDRLAAALRLQRRLEAILEGEPPFDIFVRWKPLSLQPAGWEPDIDDGVRVNIRPFLASDSIGGRSGAGVVRFPPNILWGKDSGTASPCERNDFPWYWGWDGVASDFTGGPAFDGLRWNGCHYSRRAKNLARLSRTRRKR